MPRQLRETNQNVYIAVGRRIKLRRHMLSLTQSEVAKQLGVTFQQLQKYENGTDRLSAGRLYDLSDILKAPVDYFFEDLRPAPGSEAEVVEQEDDRKIGLEKSRQGIKLLRAFAKLPDDKMRRHIASLVDELAPKKS